MRENFDELLLTNGLGLNTPKTFDQTEEILHKLKEENIELVGTCLTNPAQVYSGQRQYHPGDFAMEFWCKTKDALIELRKMVSSPNSCHFLAELFTIIMQTKQKPELFLLRQEIEAVGKPKYILLLRKFVNLAHTSFM